MYMLYTNQTANWIIILCTIYGMNIYFYDNLNEIVDYKKVFKFIYHYYYYTSGVFTKIMCFNVNKRKIKPKKESSQPRKIDDQGNYYNYVQS